ncbi:hypothetical protein TcasGA2_TC032361 [Tribolium castaneum]|uniref:Uncharacterized protein n=1 Tax=Tribolium castaneum TaxID=7070 RepID=A0A139WLZ6_TRICA|nr:hypothetical protein TcasGA2_TC032361 [Tribolium castaneum]
MFRQERAFSRKKARVWKPVFPLAWERKRSGDKGQEEPIRERLATRLDRTFRYFWSHKPAQLGLHSLGRFLLKTQTGGSSANLMACRDGSRKHGTVLHVRGNPRWHSTAGHRRTHSPHHQLIA